MRPRLSFVVVNWESDEDLTGLIESMKTHLPEAGGVELVVVDNASSVDPQGIVREWTGPVRYQRLDSNRGFGAASNAGVGLASSPVCILCNPDVRLIDGSILKLAEYALERNALVGPRLLWEDGTIQPSASGPVTGIWPWIGAVIPGSLQPRWMQRKTEPWRLESTTEVTWLTGAVIAAPTALLRELGPFDEEIELMSEDLDLGLRAGDADVSLFFAPDLAKAIHIGGRSRKRRFADEGLELAAANRMDVIERFAGAGAARRSSLAQKTRLRLRLTGKSLLGRDAAAERSELQALSRSSAIRRSP